MKIRGCSSRILFIVLIISFVLFLFGVLNGPIGEKLFHFNSLLGIHQPKPELPAEHLFEIAGFPITNSIITSWITIISLGLIFFLASRKIKLVPKGIQNFVEVIMDYLTGFVEGAAGKENGRKFFPVVATIFLFVIMNAYFSLLPIYNEAFVVHAGGKEFPLFRGANTDVNVPLAIAILSFIAVEYWGIRSHGFTRYARKFFNFGPLFGALKAFFTGKIKQSLIGIISGVIFVMVGLIELFTEVMRLVSFTFRLFGNMTAGELLILSFMFLFPLMITPAFYGLEFLIGYVQAMIFSGLTLGFAIIAVTPHSEEH